MAIVVQNTQLTIKPDVYDVIMAGDNSWDPSTTPLFSGLAKGPDTPNAVLFQFPYDIPDTPTSTGNAEGGDWTQAATVVFGGRVDLYGRQHHKKTYFGVGEVSEGNKLYSTNGKDEFTYQLRRALRFLVKSMELITVSNTESQAGDGTMTFTTRGLGNWIVDTAGIATQTDTATIVPANFRPAAAQVVTMTAVGGDYPLLESDVNGALASVYDVLKDKIDYDIHCTVQYKNKVSAWGNLIATVANTTYLRRFNQDSADKSIVATIDTWTGDSGVARFMLHPWVGTADLIEAIGIDKRFAQYRVRQQPMAQRLDPQGGGERGMAQFTMGIQCMPKYLSKWSRSA